MFLSDVDLHTNSGPHAPALTFVVDSTSYPVSAKIDGADVCLVCSEQL